MSRVARIVVPGFPHHVTPRGNRRAGVFETNGDRKAYLRFLKKYYEERALSVWAYCSMSKRVHLVVVPERALPVSAGLLKPLEAKARTGMWHRVTAGGKCRSIPCKRSR